MKENKKANNKVCFILYTISASLFLFTGIMILIEDGFKNLNSVTDIALSITFGSLALLYFRRYKEEDKD